MRLAFDLDGVIASQLEAVQIQALNKFKKAVTPEMITEFNWWGSSPLTHKQYKEIWADEDTYKLMPVVPGAITYLNKFRERGHMIYIITARQWSLWNVTRQWLEDNGVKWDYLQLSQPDKAEWFKIHDTEHPVNFYVDDFIDTCREVKGILDNVYLFDDGLPYTKNARLTRGVKRVLSWSDIDAEIERIEGELSDG